MLIRNWNCFRETGLFVAWLPFWYRSFFNTILNDSACPKIFCLHYFALILILLSWFILAVPPLSFLWYMLFLFLSFYIFGACAHLSLKLKPILYLIISLVSFLVVFERKSFLMLCTCFTQHALSFELLFHFLSVNQLLYYMSFIQNLLRRNPLYFYKLPVASEG